MLLITKNNDCTLIPLIWGLVVGCLFFGLWLAVGFHINLKKEQENYKKAKKILKIIIWGINLPTILLWTILGTVMHIKINTVECVILSLIYIV